MLLQVHDELIFEVAAHELDKTMSTIKQVMENSFKINGIELSVPLDAEGGSGADWAKAH